MSLGSEAFHSLNYEKKHSLKFHFPFIDFVISSEFGCVNLRRIFCRVFQDFTKYWTLFLIRLKEKDCKFLSIVDFILLWDFLNVICLISFFITSENRKMIKHSSINLENIIQKAFT